MRSYREHLRVPVSWWLLAIPVIAILGGELYAGFGGFIPPLIYAVFTAVVAGFLLMWGSASVEVTDGALRAGNATLPLRLSYIETRLRCTRGAAVALRCASAQRRRARSAWSSPCAARAAIPADR